MFPKPGVRRWSAVGVEFVIGMSRGSTIHWGAYPRRTGGGDRNPRTQAAELKKCGWHARYLSLDIASIYIYYKGEGGRETMVVMPIGDSFTYW